MKAQNPLFASVEPGKLVCPNCGAPEIHPDNKNLALVKWFKVYDADGTEWSHCLVCAGYYTKFLAPIPDFLLPKTCRERGWFSGAWVKR